MHLLFLLVSSEADAGPHLAVLKKIALLVENPDFYEAVMAAADAEAVHKALRRHEEILDSQDA